MRLRPEDIETFRITDLDYDSATATAVLRYALDDVVRFEERVALAAEGPAPGTPSPEQERGLEGCLRLLHLAAGVSYYKAAAPRRIVVQAPIAAHEERLCRDLYDHGLREFAYRNGLEVPRRLEIDASRPAGPVTSSGVPTAPPAPGIGIPVGGGKDSITVVDALRPRRPLLLSVNGHPAARRVAAVAGLDLVVARRTLDPVLFELNRNGALNGHVPVTAIVSLVAVATGYLHGYDTTVMALESSSDDPTRDASSQERRTADGPAIDAVVNHQWSKSRAFEVELQATLRRSVHPDVRYLSALRDVTDLQIAAAFATLKEYHPVFRSCNRSFGLHSDFDGWCRACPKCAFVYLTLATAMGRDELVAVFGGDMLADSAASGYFRELLEEGRKPFECVGTRQESLTAFRRLMVDPQWRTSPVLAELRPVIDQMARGTVDPGPERAEAVAEAVRRAVDGAVAPRSAP
jgi:hypothetical protein